MAEEITVNTRIYPGSDGSLLSMIDLLTYFEKQGAMRVSDLHIKMGTVPAYRVDGELVKLKGAPITKELFEGLVFPLIGPKNIATLRRETAVDCSYRLGEIQFRINVFLENDGMAAAIRALGLDIPKPESIGFPNSAWQDIVRRKHGLVLFTGITGAGKSTTIASLIERINENRACRIMTLEDPIEYIFKQKNSMISQREIGRDVDRFSAGLRAMMRQDPDIIFVGEMRDAETVSLTLTAAETGHLVFSTLHTRDAVGTITRILDFFPEGRQDEVRNQLSLGLAYVLSQKLLPRKDARGRVVAMEILNNNYAVANLIRKGKIEQIYSILQVKTKDQPNERMITLERHLAQLVKRGVVDLLEAQKWANDENCFIDAMKSEKG
ncbi:MAG TPA: PilT/PilU family type 4a pilus ATPase [Anaerohalosphaeraceae bacterium]|jgi:twitching motility protein PilT|nr:PilT/PilU family type 4a pilus ATPase [Anaerohalosphaeraceae bacterium]HRT49525.1 PilT/PilU family type 4a pilus ATPase [Anaerohalosphaeraceae bacterium]HRT85313.1 PilT/PilU family type 4a pilus ATPase [Anaerohalosphaeraceae bacterium]